MPSKLILLRHGESIWNKKNLFTGWVDIPMSEEGMEEAVQAGKKIQNMPIDAVFTSTLIRAQMTVPLALLHHKSGKIPVFIHPGEKRCEVYNKEAEKELIPVYCFQALNERMYGRLQGFNKGETAEKFGTEQVKIWRRSYDGRPPDGESLQMTAERALPCFKNEIVPYLAKGKTVLVAAHGNSLRSIVMEIEGLSKEEVVALELPTGEPRIYTYNNGLYVISR